MRKAGGFNKCVYPQYSSTSDRILTYFGLRSVQPRSNVARLSEKKDISPELIARVARMEGAHLVCVVFLYGDLQYLII